MVVNETNVLLRYFEVKTGRAKQEFLEEVRSLSPTEKAELSLLAAQAIGQCPVCVDPRQLQAV